MQSQLLNTPQAAKYLSVSAAFLERDRWAGARIPYVKIGTRTIRYRLEDLNLFIEKKIRRSTTQSPE